MHNSGKLFLGLFFSMACTVGFAHFTETYTQRALALTAAANSAAKATTATKMTSGQTAKATAATVPAPEAKPETPPTNEEKSSTENPDQIPIEDVKRFSRALNDIKRYYVSTTKDEVLFEDAIRGMLRGLDPHSAYLDKDEFKSLQETTDGRFSGIGIEVTMENDVIKVITPVDGTPAAKAGIKAGDYIVRIDKTPVIGLSLKDAVQKMRGLPGTPITLTIIRKDVKKPIVMTVVRNTVAVESVKSRLIEGSYGYVRVSQFQKETAHDVIASIKKLNKQAGGSIGGLILDLRNNPGGLLTSAVDVSDAFISTTKEGKDELIVYTKGRIPGADFSAVSTPGDILNNAPMIVLINEGSASASEIVAGALKDNKRAVLLGTRSFGKGSVQTIIPLDAERGIKLTTALYYTPSGTSIQAKGIQPDVVVENIKIPAAKTPAMDQNFTEADLDGHINTPGNKKARVVAAENKLDANLIHTDYQLYQAVNMLRGMAMVSGVK